MKKYWHIVIILGVISFFIYMIFTPPRITGEVFTTHGNDTIPLNSVLVKLLIDEADSGRINLDKQYITHSDSTGAYSFEFSFMPYIADYSLTFSKQGYNSLIFKKTLRRSRDLVFDAKLDQRVGARDNTRIQGSFDSSISYLDPNPQLIMFSGLIVLILIFLAVRYNLYQALKDKFAILTTKKFSQLSESDQKAIFDKEAFCKNCKANNGMVFEHEETDLGMTFLYGKCLSCQGEMKVRWK